MLSDPTARRVEEMVAWQLGRAMPVAQAEREARAILAETEPSYHGTASNLMAFTRDPFAVILAEALAAFVAEGE